MREQEPGTTRFRFGTKDYENSCYDGSSLKKDHLEVKETYINARTLDDALEHFCSSCEDLEDHVGRVGRVIHREQERQTIPKGYNALGEKFDPKPTLLSTKNIPDKQIIQVWEYDDKLPHWFWGNTRTDYRGEKITGDDKLVFELPLSEVWKYDRWNNVEHPALPAPDFGNVFLGSSLVGLETLKGRSIRSLSRAELSSLRHSLKRQKESLEIAVSQMNNQMSSLRDEMSFRGEQLKYMSLYLGRNVDIQLIQKGPKAPDSDKVCIRQRVLYMAEEVGSIQWETGFDFRNISDFDRWVCLPKNLAIIAPESKCIVFLKPRRNDADYGDPITNFFLNMENRRVYCLLRNGDTIYRAYTEIAIPDRLFPEEEKFQRDLEQRRESHIGSPSSWGWDWKEYAKLWKTRKPWYDKGFTDADFTSEIKYKTKEEMLEAKAKEEAKYEAEARNPKKEVPLSDWDLKDLYKDYQEDLKQFFFGLAFIQGIFDRTDIFGHLERKVNVFTGLGLKTLVKLIYDMSEERMLEDKDTPTLLAWLKSEASKVKVGDFVIIRSHVYRHTSSYNDYAVPINGIAKVIRIKSPGVIAAHMNRKTWRSDESKMGINQRLKNDPTSERIESLSFYPWNLPLDKLHFYVSRRAERDKYWDNLLVDLMEHKTRLLKGTVPEIGSVSSDEKIRLW